jgi:hypothetical protein
LQRLLRRSDGTLQNLRRAVAFLIHKQPALYLALET